MNIILELSSDFHGTATAASKSSAWRLEGRFFTQAFTGVYEGVQSFRVVSHGNPSVYFVSSFLLLTRSRKLALRSPDMLGCIWPIPHNLGKSRSLKDLDVDNCILQDRIFRLADPRSRSSLTQCFSSVPVLFSFTCMKR
jgi:hypothetical protein